MKPLVRFSIACVVANVNSGPALKADLDQQSAKDLEYSLCTVFIASPAWQSNNNYCLEVFCATVLWVPDQLLECYAKTRQVSHRSQDAAHSMHPRCFWFEACCSEGKDH